MTRTSDIPSPNGVTIRTKSYRIKFARRFLRSLLHIKVHSRPSSSSSSPVDETIQKRSQKIKRAAYSSMAHAVGPRMDWSRAVLFKLRKRARHHKLMKKRCLLLGNTLRKKRVFVRNTNYNPPRDQAGMLRGLVPGGESMDLCNLLEETAHYITCLATQVKVMQDIADHLSK